MQSLNKSKIRKITANYDNTTLYQSNQMFWSKSPIKHEDKNDCDNYFNNVSYLLPLLILLY
jgi:hypothetical protein